MTLPPGRRRILLASAAAIATVAAGLVGRAVLHSAPDAWADLPEGGVGIDYPADGTLFPRDVAPPVVRWTDSSGATNWQVRLDFAEGKTISAQTDRPTWTPEPDQWDVIKRRSLDGDARLAVVGRRDGRPVSGAAVTIRTSGHPVGAPLFYREVVPPFVEAVKNPARIRWRFGPVSTRTMPPIVLQNLEVCGNCHSFSNDGRVLGMDVDYGNDKGSYVVTEISPRIVLDRDKVMSWGEYRPYDGERTFGLLSAVSPDGRYVISTVKDRSVSAPRPDLEFSLDFFPVKGILVVYDRVKRTFAPLPGADDPRYVQSNAAWSPDGKTIAFVRAPVHPLAEADTAADVILTPEQAKKYLKGREPFRYDLYTVPYNDGRGGEARPLEGASGNGMSNYFPKFSPDGRWIVFCRAKGFMLLQPDSELWIVPAAGGEARRLECNTPRMNSWHSWSPNGKWLVFSSKVNGPYTQVHLTHIDDAGHASPPVALDWLTEPNRAANIPEFVNAAPDAIESIVEQYINPPVGGMARP